MKKSSFLLILCFCAYGCGGLGSADFSSPDDIRALVLENGAHATVRALAEGDAAAWANFYKQVAAGEEKWLQLVPLVIGSSDAESGTLVVALAEALPKNPEGVLALESLYVSTKEVCALPFNEMSDAALDAYYKSAMRALDGLRDEYFSDDKKMCRLRLQGAMQKVQQRRSGVYNFKQQ